MRIERSASAYYLLGVVEPSWHQPEFNRDLRADFLFKSYSRGGHLTYQGQPLDQADMLAPQLTGDEMYEVKQNLAPAVASIDQMVRNYRDYRNNVATEIKVGYRVGHGRAVAALAYLGGYLSTKAKSPYVFMPSAEPHFDRAGEPSSNPKDTVILSHGGKPTTIFDGPIIDCYFNTNEGKNLLLFASKFFITRVALGRLAALTAPNIVSLPHDVAALIDERTLHKQPSQIYKPSERPAFLRAIVKPVLN